MALVAWYKLDGNAKNNTGDSSLDGTASNVSWVDGKIGGAGSFNGSSSYITIINNTDYELSGDITISFWIYINNYHGRTTLIDKAYGGEFTINLESSMNLRLYRGIGNGNSSPYSSVDSSVLNMNEWINATIKVKDTTATWFINGVEVTSSTEGNFVGSISTNNIRFGKGYTSSYFDGLFDDVKIYDRALSESQIRRLALVDNRQLVAYYKLDGNADDSSGNNNHCTVNGITWESGLLNKSARFDSVSDYINIPTQTLNREKASLTFWMKLDDAVSNCDIFGYSPDSGTTKFFEYKVNHLHGETNSNCNYITSPTFIDSVSSNEWHHFSIVFKNRQAYWYQNGKYLGKSISYGSTNCDGITVNEMVTDTTLKYIGGGGYAPNIIGNIDDVRIYNYALSSSQIEKLAQPKILHYKFDDKREEATENLIPENMANMSSSWHDTGGVHSSITVSFPKNYEGRKDIMKAVKEGTESHDVYMGKANLYETSIGDVFILSYDVKTVYGNVDWSSPYLYQDGWKLPADNYTANRLYLGEINLGNDWRRKSYKFTIDAAGSCMLRFSSGYKSEPYEMLIDNLQFEKKEKETPFTPNTRTGAIIKDSSLSQNHGTVALVNSPVWTSGDVSYGAMEFGLEDKVLLNNPIEVYNDFTISYWFKPSRSSAYRLFNGSSYTNSIEHRNAKTIRMYPDYINFSNSAVTNDWNNLIIVRDSNNICKGFLNGVESKASVTFSDYLQLKYLGYKTDNTSWSAYEGGIDDVRIYQKAFSDSEIQTLYKEKSRQLRFNSTATAITMGGTGQLKIG